jgi:hypothetical protein
MIPITIDAVASTDRDEAGRWKPGHAFKSPGRPKKETEAAILSAISNAFSEQEITFYLQEAMRLAIEMKSPRAIVAVIELQAAYGLGRPTVRIEQQPNGLQDILRQLGQHVPNDE